jgi:hypothetical protein
LLSHDVSNPFPLVFSFANPAGVFAESIFAISAKLHPGRPANALNGMKTASWVVQPKPSMHRTEALGLHNLQFCMLFLKWQNSWPDVIIANTPASEVFAETMNARCVTSACLSGSMIASNAICKFAEAADEIDCERTAVNKNEENLGKTRLFYIPWYKLISLFC